MLSEKFNDDGPKINLNYFDVTCQDHYATFNYLCFLSRDNDYTEAFSIPTGFITATTSGDRAG